MRFIQNESLTPESLKFAKILEDKFSTVKNASDKTGFTRATIYAWIRNGQVSILAEELLKARGYNPDTFERLA